MPRPSPAQIAYGLATVMLTAVALLLLTRTESGTGAVLVASGSLVLGLVVSLTVPTRARAAQTGSAPTGAAVHPTAARPATERPLPEPSLRR
ncbi:hypothetical protein GCM10023347_35450 [Streptomyces chumphonensis]|uniref:Uncharacterized protein n=1 Tax=Streptomyces chumphonensis TaxID=1214925 RepID=A0A927IC55_9ACTN|nr:hypothetical protein [Streptomyces chumphonensis]MBD3930916.1 hypothetical protein [Streptomyces chumphonensis]